MKRCLRLLYSMASLLLFSSLCSVYALPLNTDEAVRDTSRTFILYFRFDRSLLEKDYMSNKLSMDSLRTIMTNREILAQLDSIVVMASASPEGALDRNLQLARERAAAVKTYLMWRYPYLDRNKILTYSIGENWEGLKQMVEEDKNVPYRKDVLDIIGSDLSPGIKDLQIQQVGNGTAFAYMVQNMLRYLRTGATCIVFYRKVETKPAEPVEVIIEEEVVEEVIQDTSAIAEKAEELAWQYKRPIAFKTNLLFDLATALNVEVEIPLGHRFSIAGEWMSPWWLWENKQHSFEVMLITLEGRYWLKPNFSKQEKYLNIHNPLTGWFVGLYSNMGKYDLEWNKKGYQGEVYISGGLTLGYSKPLSRNLNMEFSLSAGYMQSDYRYYKACQDALGDWHLIKQYPGSFKWIGPTKAKISLIWYPHFKSIKKGGRK